MLDITPTADTRQLFQEAIEQYILRENPSKEVLHRQKIVLAKEHKLAKIPTDIDILLHASIEHVKELTKVLRTKPVRSMSGVSIVAVMSEPRGCPHGKCTFCPGGPQSPFGDTPQSYTGHEPSTMRGMRNDWDSYRIVFNRLEHYVVTGHRPDKCDVIIMGGTFPSYEIEYREWFVKGIFGALNDFSRLFYDEHGELLLVKFKEFFELPGDLRDKERVARITEKLQALAAKAREYSIEELQKANEDAVCHCIGLTQETKPDWGLLNDGNEMLALGTTRVELGLQTLNDEALMLTHRGHGLAESVLSMQQLKDLGFKINAHMMLGLPSQSADDDEQTLKDLFSDEQFRPDMVKVYPTQVIKGTPLYEQWKQGLYTPQKYDDCVRLIGDFCAQLPRYCRIMRVQRDIPSTVIDAGVGKTNLRQDVEEYMKQHNLVGEDIRAREIKDQEIETFAIHVDEYTSSGGTEFFISVDETTHDKIIGFARLRFPKEHLRPEIVSGTALIRELHVYGKALRLGKQGKEEDVQHRGFGRMLMEKAEEIARSSGMTKMLVISGVGVRNYYRKLGYEQEGPYMGKRLDAQ